MMSEATPNSIDPAVLASGRDLVRRHPTVDIHSHPGRFFLEVARPPTAFEARHQPTFAAAAGRQLRHSGVAAAVIATVADCCLLEFGERGICTTRDYRPGEVMRDYEAQLAAARAFLAGAGLRPALTADDIRAAHRDGVAACMLSVEGGDFVEGDLGRVMRAWSDGIRLVTVIHYHSNQIGDPQTAEPRYGGLSPLGCEVVAEMNRVGMLVDMAHASFAATAQAAKLATHPIVISHSNVAFGQDRHPRLISLDHARLVTETGGVIGAIPAGFAQSSFGDYVETILRMVDALGAEHVAIGTDMDFTYRSVFPGYGAWPALAGELRRRLSETETAAVMGGNFLRVLEDVQCRAAEYIEREAVA